MKRITKKIKELGFTEQLHEIGVDEWFNISRNVYRTGQWDIKLGIKPVGWDNLPLDSNFIRRISGKLSKRDILYYAMPKIPYIRKCTRTIQSCKGGM